MNSRHGFGKRLFGLLVAGVLVFLAGASSVVASTYPANCWDVKYKNPAATDGDYMIEPSPDKAFTVYCADMNVAPKEYLPLVNTGGNYNFSQITAGGARPGTNVRTTYIKLRIDPETFLVDVDDVTFATTTGACTDCASTALYGYAADCVGSYTTTGLANIDLTGTPFAVNDTFKAQGYAAAGSATFNGQTVTLGWDQTVAIVSPVVDLTGGGYCGGVRTGSYPYHYMMKLMWAND